MEDSTIFRSIDAILKDTSFGNDSEQKLKKYAAEFPNLVTHHPMLLIYCCASNGNIDQCIRLIVTLSEFSNIKFSQKSSEEIYELIEFVVKSVKTKPILKVILESEKKYIEVIKTVPVLFFKACVDREAFDLECLQNMLAVRNRMHTEGISEHDASVNVGSLLVDKYVKPKIEHLE